MRILHITDKFFPPLGSEGGAPQSLHSLVIWQRRCHYDSAVLSIRGEAVSFCRDSYDSVFVDNAETGFDDFAPDVVHFHFSPAKLISLAERKLIPYVCHIRGIAAEGVRLRNPVFVSKTHAKNHGFSQYVYNGVALDDYPFSEGSDEYLIFLGKVKRSKKGVDTAIKVAKNVDMPLAIVGGRKVSVPSTWLPFQKLVRAYGVLQGKDKVELLSRARALLFPIRWEEPFGLVLIEAMACGVPVIAFNRGAVPEIVKDGETGFVVDDFDQMCAAVKRIDQIDRAACRQHVIDHFSIKQTVQGVGHYYKKAIAGETW